MESIIISRKLLVDYLLLVFILSVYAINLYFIINLDSAPPKWDEAVHLRDSFVYYNIISDPFQLNLQVIKDIINKSDLYPLIRPSGYYPPMVPILTSLIYFIFGTSAKVAVMSNIIFLFILIFSVYKIGTLMFDRNVGLLASVLILLFPIILQHSVIYYLDLPLAAVTALSILTLLKANSFRNTKFSAIAGFCFGLGMLTKWTFLFFIVGPLFYFIIKAFNSDSTKKESKISFLSNRPLKNFILFTIISIATFAPYYLPILAELIRETFKYTGGPLTHSSHSVFSFGSALFYLISLWKDMITPFGFVLFTLGIALLSISKTKYKTLLFICTITPYILTFIIQNKTARYMMPWLIPVSIIISFCINEISGLKILNREFKFGKYFLPLSLVVFGILFLSENSRLKDSIIGSSKENWKINEMVSILEQDMISSKKIIKSSYKPIYLGTIPDHEYINGQTIRYYASLRKLPLNVIKLQDYTNSAFEKFVQKFDRYDYVLTKNLSNIVIPSFQKSVEDMNNYFHSHGDNFECLKIFYEPDGSEVSIFRKKE